MNEKLPDLPDPEDYGGTAYTADQMRAYAQQAIAQARKEAFEEAARICEETYKKNPLRIHGTGQYFLECAGAIRARTNEAG